MANTTNLINIANALSITATGQQAGQLLQVSPFEGGRNRNAWLTLAAAVGGAGVVQIMGSDLPQGNPTPPPTNDPSWQVLYTLNSASPLRQEIQLPVWIAVNVQTAGTGTVTINLEGIK
jgi:hypothetical protein